MHWNLLFYRTHNISSFFFLLAVRNPQMKNSSHLQLYNAQRLNSLKYRSLEHYTRESARHTHNNNNKKGEKKFVKNLKTKKKI